MYVFRRNKLTGDYSYIASTNEKHMIHLDVADFNHGINEFFIVESEEEANKLIDKLEEEFNRKRG